MFIKALEELLGLKGIFLISFLQITSYFSYKRTRRVSLSVAKLKMSLLSELTKPEFLVLSFVYIKLFFGSEIVSGV